MFNIPTTFNLNGLTKFIDTVVIPDKLTIEDIDKVTSDIKALKTLAVQISTEKKLAQEPHEKERSKYSALFEQAKLDKKLAGEPFVALEKWVADTEAKLRAMINAAVAEVERKKREAEAEAKRLADETERKRLQAEEALAKARMTDSSTDKIAAANAARDAHETQRRLHDAQFAVHSQEHTPAPVTTRTVNVLDFEVQDILKVPEEYVDYIPNMKLIYAAVTKKFPFITDMTVMINPEITPDEYMHDEVNSDKVMEVLKQGKEIPGIKKLYHQKVQLR